LKKNKDKKLFTQIKKIKESSIDFSKNLAESSVDCFTNSAELFSFSVQNFAELFENISLSERTRNEVSKVILQKLKNRHSEAFKDHKKSFHSIISSSFSEAEMTSQHFERIDQNMQETIQAVIREMMSKIIQQSVAATLNVIAATTRSDSSLTSDHPQIISRATSESRIDR
jgi:replication initiation and membrane attachment protein DnaB